MGKGAGVGVVVNKVRVRPPEGSDSAPLHGVTLAIRTGELVAVVGNDGSGAQTLAHLLTAPLPEGATATGRIRIDGVNPHAGTVPPDQLAGYVGAQPVLDGKLTVGRQLSDALLHAGFDRREVDRRAGALLRAVGLGSAYGTSVRALGVLDSHRADFALALASGAKVLVAERFGEESDTYVRAELRQLLREAHEHLGLTVIVVTQDLGGVADLAERVVLLDAGHVVADAPVRTFFASPPVQLARSLIAAAPRLTLAERASGRAAVAKALRRVRAAEAQDAQAVLQRRARAREDAEERARLAGAAGADLADTPADAVGYADHTGAATVIELDHVVDGAHVAAPRGTEAARGEVDLAHNLRSGHSGHPGRPEALGGDEHGPGHAAGLLTDVADDAEDAWFADEIEVEAWDDDTIPLDAEDAFDEAAFFGDEINGEVPVDEFDDATLPATEDLAPGHEVFPRTRERGRSLVHRLLRRPAPPTFRRLPGDEVGEAEPPAAEDFALALAGRPQRALPGPDAPAAAGNGASDDDDDLRPAADHETASPGEGAEAAEVADNAEGPDTGAATDADGGVDLADTPREDDERVPRFRADEFAPERPTPVLEVEVLHIAHKERWFRAEREVLSGIDLTLVRGETLGILGPSRSGSSMLLRALDGREELTSGSITITGRTALLGPDPRREDRPGRTLRDALHDALRPQLTEIDENDLDFRAHQLLREIGRNTDALGSTLDTLSDGERLALAFAERLAARPTVLLLDEPTLLLDTIAARAFVTLVRRVQERRHFSVVVAAHDPAILVGVADRVVVLDRGRIVETGVAKDVLSSPADPVTERLVLSVPIPNPLLQARRRELRRTVLATHAPLP